ncbi:unnamed protein product [Penicillium camemberti]|uniref:Str. FM013 n=1 Tax=Penicillium camemberti (strain FM 013) TaxID=1429867 RepID=A0A0G4PTZ7_PENC3|nr:unnamed protein product [Penicillium camemberti]
MLEPISQLSLIPAHYGVDMVSLCCTFQPSGNFTGEGDRVLPAWGNDRNRPVTLVC